LLIQCDWNVIAITVKLCGMKHHLVDRRQLLALAAFGITNRHGMATDKPWKQNFLYGGFDGSIHHAGLAIKLERGWKTYWRVPGEGGIPPAIMVQGENVATADVGYPVPSRIIGADGESLGFKGEVVFPIRIVPADPAQKVSLQFSSFVGVCDVVCIPARFDHAAELPPVAHSTADLAVIERWRNRVPKPGRGPVTHAHWQDGSLSFGLLSRVDELFVDFMDGGLLFSHAPEISGGTATARVSGLKAGSSLSGRAIKVYPVVDGLAVEQDLVVG
jgi:hypothetical protein